MSLLRSYIRHTPGDRRLLLKALPLVVALRILLSVRGIDAVRRVARYCSIVRYNPRVSDAAAPERLAWAIRRAARLVPDATCLTQSLALHILMARRGLESELRIGVAKDDRSGFAAHAWVESGGKIVIGGDVSRFTKMFDLRELHS